MGSSLFARWHAWARLALGLAVAALILAGCALHDGRDQRDQAMSTGAAATFGADGRLWRATAGTQYLFVDYSSDAGKTFSRAVAVNAKAQRIRASSEDRPNIAVDKTGRIWVSYAADAVQPGTAYFSFSDNDGSSFSEPTPISDQAASARAFLATLALDSESRPHFFWHDERDSNASQTSDHGGSLYYARMDTPSAHTPVAKRILRTACARCPIKVAFDKDGLPVLFSRFVFPVKERDHGLVKITSDGKGWSSWRVTDDNWETDACPEHGPAFSIALDGRYHVAWFTQGKNRQGLFYAWSGDHGKHFRSFMPFGDKKALAGHPALLSLERKVALAWQEFDGRHSQIKAMLSLDGGEHWSATQLLIQAKGAADYPLLISNGRQIYLSWNGEELGYRLIALD